MAEDLITQARAASKAIIEEARSPKGKKEAKHIVDAMVKEGKGDIYNLPLDSGVRGIPSTREEFDKYYADTGHLEVSGKEIVKEAAKLVNIPEMAEICADHQVMDIKFIEANIIAEMKRRGIDTKEYEATLLKKTLVPADIDLDTLDPRLSDDERKYVELYVRASKIIGDGRLASTAEDAPANSRWANKIKLEQGLIEEDKPRRVN